MPPLNTLNKTGLALAICHAMANPAHASSILVDSALDDDGVGCTLREAVQSMNNAAVGATGCVNTGGTFGSDDEITFSVGSIALTGGQLDINVDLTVTGQASNVTIDAGGNSRILNLDQNDTTITLDNLTLTNGKVTGDYNNGAGIRASNVTLNLNNSTVSGSSGQYEGGGMYAKNSTVNLNNSTLSGNRVASNYGGGGIFIKNNSSLTVSNSSITGNYLDLGGAGGGIYATNNNQISLINSTVSGNFAPRGGGIYLAQSNIDVTGDSHITSNTASNSNVNNSDGAGGGGGIYARDDSVITVSDSTLSGNSASDDNGGAIGSNGATVTLSNSTVHTNFSDKKGGGIFSSGPLILSNSTVSTNSSNGQGGGIYTNTGSVSLSNSTVSDNSSGEIGAGVYNEGADCHNASGTITADNKNIIQDGSCGTQALAVDPMLAPLADNGGSTQTHALLKNSPAINAGDDAVCAAAPVNNLDQRGESRPIGSACDIGAFESEFGQEDTSFFVVPLNNGKAVIFGL